jgi:rhodanese-related sulfurtransferase
MVAEIQPRDLADRLHAGHPIYLLDVRQPWEHQTAAVAGSHLIPLNELPARTAEVAPPPGALVVVYCHHGQRSLRAAMYLEQLGLTGVASLAGGIDAWSCEVDPGVPRY